MDHYEKHHDIEYFKKHFKGYFKNSDLADSHYHLSTRYQLGEPEVGPMYRYIDSIVERDENNVYIMEGHKMVI